MCWLLLELAVHTTASGMSCGDRQEAGSTGGRFCRCAKRTTQRSKVQMGKPEILEYGMVHVSRTSVARDVSRLTALMIYLILH